MPDPEISIIIPTYNEKENVALIVADVHRVLGDIPHEIIVVDDDSPDNTGQVVKNLIEHADYPLKLITRQKKEGLGAALKTGYNEARGRFIASIDADMSFQTSDLRILYEECLKGADLVTGNFHADKKLYETPTPAVKIKHWFSINGNRLIRFATGIPVGSFSANLRMIRNTTWRAIKTEEKTNSMLFEMIVQVWLIGGSVKDIPVSFRNRRWGRSKMRIGIEAPKYFLKLLFFLIHCRKETNRRKSFQAQNSPRARNH